MSSLCSSRHEPTIITCSLLEWKLELRMTGAHTSTSPKTSCTQLIDPTMRIVHCHVIFSAFYTLSFAFYRLTALYHNPNSFFFFNDTATTEIYTLSLHDALPISCRPPARG